jgi:hypothetical protein
VSSADRPGKPSGLAGGLTRRDAPILRVKFRPCQRFQPQIRRSGTVSRRGCALDLRTKNACEWFPNRGCLAKMAVMDFNLDRVRKNVQSASTEDLLDRATVYRGGLEPEALPVILEELRTRGISAEAIVEHERQRGEVVLDDRGVTQKCSHCYRPAVVREWGWHQLFGKVPVFPRTFWRCELHKRD